MSAIRTVGTDHFAVLGRKLRAASNGKAIRTALSKQLRAAGRPVVRDVQAEVRGLSVRGVSGGGRAVRAEHWMSSHKRAGRGGHGLRAAAARTVKLQIRYAGRQVGIRIWSDPSSMPPNQRTLPVHLNSPRGWSHPVYGHRDRWSRQVAGQWFEPPIERARSTFRNAVQLAVEDALRSLR